MHTFLPRRALPVAVLSLLAACPAPTGRRRGERADGWGACTSSTAPNPGFPCSPEDQVCDAVRPCGLEGSFEVDTCTCRSGTWQCIQGPCNSPGPDGGMEVCPSMVRHGDACTARQSGLSCTGFSQDCHGAAVRGPCFCTGSAWACRDACSPDGGDPCAGPSACGGCTARGGCGWCAASASCASGDPTGSTDGSCRGSAWIWTPGQCPQDGGASDADPADATDAIAIDIGTGVDR